MITLTTNCHEWNYYVKEHEYFLRLLICIAKLPFKKIVLIYPSAEAVLRISFHPLLPSQTNIAFDNIRNFNMYKMVIVL